MEIKYAICLILFFYFTPVYYQIYILIKENKEESKKALKRLFLFIKICLGLFIFSTAFILTINHINFLNYESPISYKEYDRIKFENFRGLEFFQKTLHGNKRFAYVVTSIDYDINENYINVESYFHPSKSFVYNRKTKSEELLKHEKYHFKITELYARMIKKEIFTKKLTSKKDIEKVIAKNLKLENQFQKEYDYNTYHSYILDEQIRYEKLTDSLLNLHSQFADSKLNLIQ